MERIAAISRCFGNEKPSSRRRSCHMMSYDGACVLSIITLLWCPNAHTQVRSSHVPGESVPIICYRTFPNAHTLLHVLPLYTYYWHSIVMLKCAHALLHVPGEFEYILYDTLFLSWPMLKCICDIALLLVLLWWCSKAHMLPCTFLGRVAKGVYLTIPPGRTPCAS